MMSVRRVGGCSGALRPKPMRVAYRMLGSVADAEDVLQEAFIRWAKAERGEVREPEAFLRRTVARRLDQLRTAGRRRETYLGPWPPDPIVTQADDEDVTLQREAAACRQLAARARTHVREARPRFKVEQSRGAELAKAFFEASRSGDMQAPGAMLAADVNLHADGGGKRPAAMKPILGFEAVMRNQARLAPLYAKHESRFLRAAYVNGLPGFVTLEADGEIQTTALAIEDGKIVAIHVMRNPDKLAHLH